MKGELNQPLRPAMFRTIFAAVVSLGLLVSTTHAQSVANGRYFGSTLLCDNGFKAIGARCVALPPVTNGHYFRDTLLCDNGYRDSGGQCVALAAVTNGRYFRDTLLCDNGYRDSGGQCVALAAVTNGHYFRDTLLCDNGFTEFGGQCLATESLGAQGESPAVGTCAENGSCYGDPSEVTGRPKTVSVDGYYRKDGTYVRGHYRSKPSKGSTASKSKSGKRP